MIRKLISRFGVNHGCGGGTVAKAKTLRCEAFFQSDWRSKSVEQLSQLFLARHASGLEREHLGQMFYNECFTTLAKTANSGFLHPEKSFTALGLGGEGFSKDDFLPRGNDLRNHLMVEVVVPNFYNDKSLA